MGSLTSYDLPEAAVHSGDHCRLIRLLDSCYKLKEESEHKKKKNEKRDSICVCMKYVRAFCTCFAGIRSFKATPVPKLLSALGIIDSRQHGALQ